jgi:hypothetical protein
VVQKATGSGAVPPPSPDGATGPTGPADPETTR